MVRVTNGTARTHPFSKSRNLLEVDFTVWNWRRRRSWKNERRTWYTKFHSVGLWGLSGVSSTLPYLLGCAIPVSTSMCSSTIVTSTCVNNVHLCIYYIFIYTHIHIYIYIYVIYVCNITWPTYQCDTPQPPFLHMAPFAHSILIHKTHRFFPFDSRRLCTRAHEEHQIGMPPGNFDSAEINYLKCWPNFGVTYQFWCKWIMNDYCIYLYI